ncbi:MAG: hypothetical protein ABI615_00060 [Chthoniobacterales bacterium]
MSNTIHDCGFVYVATGDRYWQEAADSAAQLRRTNPGRRICLITDAVRAGTPFWDDLVILENPCFGFRDKVEMRRCPYERFVYLDTDTHTFGDLSDLFAMLNQFDACGVQLFEGHDYHVKGIPYAYSETNAGMLGFHKGPEVDAFFEEWVRLYAEFRAQNQGENYHYANVGDQKSLRVALWNSKLRFAFVGPEFNFIPFRNDFAALPVKVLHTRATQNLEKLVARLNATLGRRAYFPALDVIISNEIPDAELHRLLTTTLTQIFRRTMRKFTPLGLRTWLRGFTSIRTLFLGNRYESPSAQNEKKWEKPPSLNP